MIVTACIRLAVVRLSRWTSFVCACLLAFFPAAAQEQKVLDDEGARQAIELVYLGYRSGRLAVTFSSKENESDIYLIDFNTLEVRPLVATGSAESNPRWSNDGKFLAYDSDHSGESGIYVKSLVNPDAEDRLLVTYPGAQQPDWSPDDAYLVFSARNRDGKGRSLLLTNVQDGKTRRLHRSEDSIASPRWSPKGTELVFSSNHSWPGWDLVLLNVNTLERATVTKGVQNYVRPVWLPNGSGLTFSYGSAREYDLWKLQKGSSETEELLALAGREFDPEWSTDGRTLFFVAEDAPGSRKYELFMRDAESGQVHQLTRSLASIRALSYSPFPLPPVQPSLPAEASATETTARSDTKARPKKPRR